MEHSDSSAKDDFIGVTARAQDPLTREELEAQKSLLIDAINREAPTHVRDLCLRFIGVLDALHSLKMNALLNVGPYSVYRQPIEAIVKHLAKVGHPMSRPSLIEAIVEGGFGPHDDNRVKNIRAAIDYAVNGSKKLLIVRRRYVALPEWDGEKIRGRDWEDR